MSEEKKELKPLSKKNQRILDEFFICGIQYKAYQAVHPTASETTARTLSSRLFADVNFKAHLLARYEEIHMGADEALKRLSDMARGDLGDFLEITSMGQNINLSKAKELGKTHLIKRVKQKTVTINGKNEDKEIHTEEIELHDPRASLVDILKIHKKFTDAPTVNINMSWKDFIEGKTKEDKV